MDMVRCCCWSWWCCMLHCSPGKMPFHLTMYRTCTLLLMTIKKLWILIVADSVLSMFIRHLFCHLSCSEACHDQSFEIIKTCANVKQAHKNIKQTAFKAVDIFIMSARVSCRTHPRGTRDCPNDLGLGLDPHACECTQLTADLIKAYRHELSLCYFSIRPGVSWVQHWDIKGRVQGFQLNLCAKSLAYTVWLS